MTITIAGAGVAGLCCAFELAQQGHSVTVFEKSGALGANTCSQFAGGMLAPWCERETADDMVLTQGQKSIDWWDKITKVTRLGTLVVAPQRDHAELARFARRTTGHCPADTAELEPELGERPGLFYPDEAHLDPEKALRDLAAACVDRGVEFLFDSIAPDDVMINCTGVFAGLPDLRNVRGEMVLLRCPSLTLRRTIRLLHPRFPAYLVPRGNGLYMLGATMIESDASGPVSLRSMMELLGAAFTLHPAFAEAEIIKTGTGLRPSFPNNLPRVQQIDGTWHVNGLYRHGFLLAPAMAMDLVRKMGIPNENIC